MHEERAAGLAPARCSMHEVGMVSLRRGAPPRMYSAGLVERYASANPSTQTPIDFCDGSSRSTCRSVSCQARCCTGRVLVLRQLRSALTGCSLESLLLSRLKLFQ